MRYGNGLLSMMTSAFLLSPHSKSSIEIEIIIECSARVGTAEIKWLHGT